MKDKTTLTCSLIVDAKTSWLLEADHYVVLSFDPGEWYADLFFVTLQGFIDNGLATQGVVFTEDEVSLFTFFLYVNRLVDNDQEEKAAAIAIFFLKMKKALEILSTSASNGDNGELCFLFAWMCGSK